MVYYIPRWRKLFYSQFLYWDYLSSWLTLSRKNCFRIGERSNSHWGNIETDFNLFSYRRLQLVFMHENHPTGCSTGIVKSNMLMRELWNTKYELGLVFSFHWGRAILRFSFGKIPQSFRNYLPLMTLEVHNCGNIKNTSEINY